MLNYKVDRSARFERICSAQVSGLGVQYVGRYNCRERYGTHFVECNVLGDPLGKKNTVNDMLTRVIVRT